MIIISRFYFDPQFHGDTAMVVICRTLGDEEHSLLLYGPLAEKKEAEGFLREKGWVQKDDDTYYWYRSLKKSYPLAQIVFLNKADELDRAH